MARWSEKRTAIESERERSRGTLGCEKRDRERESERERERNRACREREKEGGRVRLGVGVPRVAREETEEWGDSLAETSRVPASGRDGYSVHRREPYRAVGLHAVSRVRFNPRFPSRSSAVGHSPITVIS